MELATNPASFQRLMDLVLRELVWSECYVFIDNVNIFGNTIAEHARRLSHFLERFEGEDLQLQPAKCKFAQPQVEYLGYIESRDGIRATHDKTKAVRNFPVPKNVKEYDRS
jgi:putative transposase